VRYHLLRVRVGVRARARVEVRVRAIHHLEEWVAGN